MQHVSDHCMLYNPHNFVICTSCTQSSCYYQLSVHKPAGSLADWLPGSCGREKQMDTPLDKAKPYVPEKCSSQVLYAGDIVAAAAMLHMRRSVITHHLHTYASTISNSKPATHCHPQPCQATCECHAGNDAMSCCNSQSGSLYSTSCR